MDKTGLCLSVQQPWAWLIVNGYKDIENRDWATKVRGRIGIHAGKKVDAEGYEWVRSARPDIPLPPMSALEKGGIVGAVDLTGCITESSSSWFFGLYGF